MRFAKIYGNPINWVGVAGRLLMLLGGILAVFFASELWLQIAGMLVVVIISIAMGGHIENWQNVNHLLRRGYAPDAAKRLLTAPDSRER